MLLWELRVDLGRCDRAVLLLLRVPVRVGTLGGLLQVDIELGRAGFLLMFRLHDVRLWWWFVRLDLGEAGLVGLDIGGRGGEGGINGGTGWRCLARTSARSSLPVREIAVTLAKLDAARRGRDTSGDIQSVHGGRDVAGASDARALVSGLGSIVIAIGGGIGNTGGIIILSSQLVFSNLVVEKLTPSEV